jgi:signal transduction histidine kinase
VTFEIPLAINLQRRAVSEEESQALENALIIAAQTGAERALHPIALQEWVYANFPHQENGRVIVVDPRGILIADSLGAQNLGQQYATAGRPELQTVIATHAPTSEIRYSSTLRQEILVAAAPILDGATFYGVVRRTWGMGEVQNRVRRVILGLVVIGLAALVAGLIIAFALAGSLSRPLARLAAAAKRLGGGDLSARTDEKVGASEIVGLSASFDEMASRLESTVRAQREFVANASHQLRTPLTGMKLRIESAIDASGSDDQRRQLEAADEEVDRLAEIVERLLVMARRIEQGGAAEVDLRENAVAALARWEERAGRLGAQLFVKGEGARALGDRADIDQILDNLIDNAIAYAPGPIVIETGSAAGRAFLAVEDRGPGIAPDERQRVTERFFRGRRAPAGGSGLGLAIVRELAEKWGGSVIVTAPAEGGTRVEVRLRPPGGVEDPSRLTSS